MFKKTTLSLCSVCAPAMGRLTMSRAVRVAIGTSGSARRMMSTDPVYKEGIHRSNAKKLIDSVPVIEVPGHVAVCDGGSGALGHPVEYIQLDTVSNKPAVCKYCGLRYKMGEVHAH